MRGTSYCISIPRPSPPPRYARWSARKVLTSWAQSYVWSHRPAFPWSLARPLIGDTVCARLGTRKTRSHAGQALAGLLYSVGALHRVRPGKWGVLPRRITSP